MPKSKAHTPIYLVAQVRTFDEAFEELHITTDERAALVWHLAAFRARRTIEALLPETNAKLALGFDPQDILRRGN
jgi:hypothetical protein